MFDSSARVRGRFQRILAVVASILFLAGIVPTPALPLPAQLRGTVRADDGSLMPGVMVTLTCSPGETSPPAVRVMTGADGAFDFRDLDSGTPCLLRAEIPGYATIVVGPIQLRPGKINVQEVRLIPAADMTTSVVVEATGATVDTETATTSTTINQEYIEALPLVGRSFQDLLTLAPGVTDVDGDGNPNVHGARDTGLQYRLDGADITDPLTGHFGQVLNLDAIQEVELITSGASAEYGRADGGFANVITKSGGNEFEGSIRLFYRTKFFDSEGAGNNDTFRGALTPSPSFRDMKSAFTLGGPIVKNRVWYFASVQSMDIETPISFGGAGVITQSDRGYQGLAKVTWQVSSSNKVALQGSFDPQRYGGLGLGPGVLPESDFVLTTGGLAASLKWTSILSPVLLMETTIARYESGQSYQPISSRFSPTKVTVRQQPGGVGFYAFYPCDQINCDRSIGTTNLYQYDQNTNETSGPFYFRDADQRGRHSIRSDFTLTLDDHWGSHTIKSGFEFTGESYADRVVNNPILSSNTRPVRFGSRTGAGDPYGVEGFQLLTVFDALDPDLRSSGGGIGSYVQENWKPVPNLTLGFGGRIDQEVVDTFGKEPFPLRAQAREALKVFDLACATAGVLCELNRTPGRPSSGLPLTIPAPPGSPLAKYDLNEDGVFDSGRDQDGAAIWGVYTKPEERQSENFTISNTNVAPRLSFAWDPWNDGRTRVSGSFGRYYDRLFLAEVTAEQNSDLLNFVFFPGSDPANHITPGDRSLPTLTRSIFMVNRNLTTPYVQERTISVEREIAPEWSISVTSIGKREWNLLQDFDVNHILCSDFRRVLDVDPHTVCGAGPGKLNEDLFGGVFNVQGRDDIPTDPNPLAGGRTSPNGAPDLYNLNPNFDQVFRLGNYNGSRYRALEIVLNRRLHRNWQMQASYSRSSAIGDAESFLSFLGDDPAARDHERGYLDYDQRHVVKFFASTNLPKRIVLGGTVEWASGTPYSAISRLTDFDDVNNASSRITYADGQRNNQRNGGAWTASARIQKGFHVMKSSAEAYFAVENILNSDDLVLREISAAGQGLGIRSFNRRFGRRWEMGASMHF